MTALMILYFFLTAAQVEAPDGVGLQIHRPLEGKTYIAHRFDMKKPEEKPINIQLSVQNPPEQLLYVRVVCFKTVRWFVIDPSVAETRAKIKAGKINFIDRYVPATEGHHILTVELFTESLDQSFLWKKVEFDVKAAEGLDQDRIDLNVRTPLCVAPAKLFEAERNYELHSHAAGSRTDLGDSLAKAADQLYQARIDQLLKRVGALAELGHGYDQILDPEHALGALEMAAEFYEREAPKIGIHPVRGNIGIKFGSSKTPPMFMYRLSTLYARYGYTDEAVKWRNAVAEWSLERMHLPGLEQKERDHARARVVSAYQEMAGFYMLFERDLENYRLYMGKAEEMKNSGS